MWRNTLLFRLCVGASGLALAAGLALFLHASATERIYSFATMQQGLRQNPGAWLGRTILVRAKVAGMAVPQSAGLAAAQGKVAGFAVAYLFGKFAMLVPRGAAPAPPSEGSFALLVPSTANMYGITFLTVPQFWAASRLQPDLSAAFVNVLHRLPLIGPLVPAPTPWPRATLLRLTLLPSRQRPCLLSLCAVAEIDDIIH